MSVKGDMHSSRRLTGPGARLIVATVTFGCLGVVLTSPAYIAPDHAPPLRFDPNEVEAVLSNGASELPSNDEAARLWSLYEAQGRAEAGEGEAEDEFEQRRNEIGEAKRALVEAHGESALSSMRSYAMSRLDVAMGGGVDAEGALLGSFPRILERYGAMRDGRATAPPIVLHALFAARFNAIMQLEPLDGLSAVEVQAYWGWLAVTSASIPTDRRVEAARAFVDAGGEPSSEVAAWLNFTMGEYGAAARRYQAAAEERDDWRLRNHALAAQSMIE